MIIYNSIHDFIFNNTKFFCAKKSKIKKQKNLLLTQLCRQEQLL